MREREDGKWMHECFQRSLCSLRLRAARDLAAAILEGGQQGGTHPGLTVTAMVQGVGLRLRLSFQLLLPVGAPPAPNLQLLLRCPTAAPRMEPPLIQVPLLLPGLRYTVGSWMELDKDSSPPQYLQVLVLRRDWSSVLQSLLVNLPAWAEQRAA